MDEDEDVGGGQMDIKKDGSVHIRRGKAIAGDPLVPEDLRTRYRIMAIHWETIAMKHPEKPFARDFDMDIFSDQVEFLLGEDGWGLRALDGSGAVCGQPT
ncbi:MAG: hypothetical protein NXI07_15260, partial [bacterium]|nr:hypothetical protein [bacterium]